MVIYLSYFTKQYVIDTAESPIMTIQQRDMWIWIWSSRIVSRV